ncbi:MAG TPA: DUF2785 domain-containing protein [Marmoricola sp.]|jgi:hypothetical protein|nr:DUF2785 domain-containing protein [Marmoricola sp.]
MASGFWEHVVASGLQVPTDRSLVEMTEDLTRMLGDPDPDVRDGIAFPTLATWIDEGVYDDLLVGLGDGLCHGLDIGLGRPEDDSVFRRSFSALALTECIDRSTTTGLAGPEVVLRWGDRVMSWLAREQDLRGFVPGKGWAHALAHGADALGALARSPYIGRLELTVILDVIGDRLLTPTEVFFVAGEDDRLAYATMHLLHRDVLGLEVVEPWVARIAAGARPSGDAHDYPERHPYRVAGNVQGYLRSLQLQLALGAEHPACRTDLLLVLISHLRATNPAYFASSRAH